MKSHEQRVLQVLALHRISGAGEDVKSAADALLDLMLLRWEGVVIATDSSSREREAAVAEIFSLLMLTTPEGEPICRLGEILEFWRFESGTCKPGELSLPHFLHRLRSLKECCIARRKLENMPQGDPHAGAPCDPLW